MDSGTASNRELIDWVEILRMPLIISVVLIHTYDPVRSAAGELISLQGRDNTTDFITFLFSNVLCRLAVPLFFIFSGYFFVASYVKGISRPQLAHMLRKRMVSVGAPYLFWNTAFLLLLLSLTQFSIYTPASDSKYFSITNPNTSLGVLAQAYGIGTYPLVYQFWFLRDLLVVFLIVGIVVFLGRHMFLAIYGLTAIAWLLNFRSAWLESSSVFFFMTGVLMREHNIFRAVLPKIPAGIIFLYLVLAGFEFFLIGMEYYNLYHKFVILIGVLSAYQIAKSISINGAAKDFWLRLAPASFFVYAVHEPTLTIIKKQLFAAIHSGIPPLAIYFCCAAIATLLSIFAFFICVRAFPGLTAFATGGRR